MMIIITTEVSFSPRAIFERRTYICALALLQYTRNINRRDTPCSFQRYKRAKNNKRSLRRPGEKAYGRTLQPYERKFYNPFPYARELLVGAFLRKMV